MRHVLSREGEHRRGRLSRRAGLAEPFDEGPSLQHGAALGVKISLGGRNIDLEFGKIGNRNANPDLSHWTQGIGMQADGAAGYCA